MQACDRRQMANGGDGIGPILCGPGVFSERHDPRGPVLQIRAGRLMKMGIVEHDQELGRRATRPARRPSGPPRGCAKFSKFVRAKCCKW